MRICVHARRQQETLLVSGSFTSAENFIPGQAALQRDRACPALQIHF
ncbi:MAG: hypothetical protein JNL59_03405 [Chitinophagaceae bacterium]|nr:hypothetical protein [Chitinophagaceae bacterium]